MKVSYGLPVHHVDPAGGLATGGAVVELSRAAEAAGFDAVYVTEHPIPADGWLDSGGHHALDPMTTLAVAGTATERVLLHTNLFIPAYRNPFLSAKAIATLDVLTGGRVVLGIGTGYLEGEFKALGVAMEERNDLTDEAIRAMQAAWTGESVTMEGRGFVAAGNTMLPRPVQRPHPPIWVGGNSKRAIRRAVELGQGWSPFPNPPSVAERTRTSPLLTPEDLAGRLAYAREHAARVGRSEPLEVAFIPKGLSMRQRESGLQADEVIASCTELSAVGVGWVTVAFPGTDVGAQLEAIAEFGEAVLPSVASLEAPPALG